MRDYFTNSFRNLKRDKKNKILISIFTLLLLLLFVDSVIIKNFYDYYDYAVNKNVGFRILSVSEPNKSSKETIPEISKLDHVIVVYESRHHRTALQSDILDNGSNGWIAILYGISELAPKSLIGKSVSEISSNEMICPYKFYPDSRYPEVLNIDENKLLSEKELLGREVTLYKNISSGNDSSDEKETIKMKIVGLYDESVYKNGVNACYVSPSDMVEIIGPDLYEGTEFEYSILNVVVDEKENLNDVRKNIENIEGYFVDDSTYTSLDMEFVTMLFLITIIFLIIVFIAFFTIFKNYIAKKVQSNRNYLGTLRACGYTKKQVTIQEILDNTIVLIISFIISFGIFEISFIILNNKIFKYFQYIGFNVNNNVILLLLLFILVFFSSIIINYLIVSKTVGGSIIESLKEN